MTIPMIRTHEMTSTSSQEQMVQSGGTLELQMSQHPDVRIIRRHRRIRTAKRFCMKLCIATALISIGFAAGRISASGEMAAPFLTASKTSLGPMHAPSPPGAAPPLHARPLALGAQPRPGAPPPMAPPRGPPSVATARSSPRDLLINEVASSGSATSLVCTGEDWIELHNPTGGNIDLRGLILCDSDGPNNDKALTLGDVAAGCPHVLPSRQFLLLCKGGAATRHGPNSAPPDQLEEREGCGFTFGIGASDTVSLLMPDGREQIDSTGNLDGKGHDSRTSAGRLQPTKTAPFVELQCRTPGRFNDNSRACDDNISDGAIPALAAPPALPVDLHSRRIDLSAYTLVRSWVLPDMSDDLSGGISLNVNAGEQRRVILITNDPTQLWEYEVPRDNAVAPQLMRSVLLRDLEDTEGIGLISQPVLGGSFTAVVCEERKHRLHEFQLPWQATAGVTSTTDTVSLTDAQRSFHLSGITTASPNKGIEGVAYDSQQVRTSAMSLDPFSCVS